MHVAETPCSTRMQVTSPDGQTQELLTFCSNDYLGLANHPALKNALAEGAQRFGTGSGASHLISGHSRAHADLEKEIAARFDPYIPGASALVLSTGYMANMAILSAIAEKDSTIFSDKLNHASIVDGAQLAKVWTGCKVERYPHADIETLRKKLNTCTTRWRFIVTDSVFSMDGDLAPLPELLALAETFDAILIIDDAHGFGVLGEHGVGCLEHFRLRSERLILMGTLGKAAGVGGAFVCAHRRVIEWMINTARPAIYTTASSPAIAHAVSVSLQIVHSEEGAQRRRRLQALIKQLRTGLKPLALKMNWSLLPSATPIQILMVGDNTTALMLSDNLKKQAIWVPAIRPPTVPEGQARLRLTLCADHTSDDINCLMSALKNSSSRL
jgi:8-amino-7-oxononanoate synthase